MARKTPIDAELIRKRMKELEPARNAAYEILKNQPYLTAAPLCRLLEEKGFPGIDKRATHNWIHSARKWWGKGGQAPEVIPKVIPEFDPIEYILKNPDKAVDIGMMMLSAMLKRNDVQQKHIDELKEAVRGYQERELKFTVDRKKLMGEINDYHIQLKRFTGHFDIDPDTHNLIPK